MEDFSHNLTHPSFPQPKDTNIKVWRYITLSKLVRIITSKKLFFSRIDLLGDPHEGSYPKATGEEYYGNFKEQELPAVRNLNSEVRLSIYVNCWRASQHESEAMWKLYCPNDEGVAIQTTYKKLADSVITSNNSYIGMVKYIDYENEAFASNNFLYPPMHKRRAFEHENEIRAIKLRDDFWGGSVPKPPIVPEGLMLDWDLTHHCEKIYVNPYAKEWYYQTIVDLLKSLEIYIDVEWSRMKSQPIF